ncbi:thiol:disulfide interchange protein DsbG [Frateuria soli]|uniref:thiol:disulfide interchange protein DsbG n=1 Tax=Frateuria soli TaxID=1542730 RepID=UPI001E2BAB23|nr:thiol:disulfide interchange protein DsbG [Frateuria soli]UGB39547.1 thiol:disulfide interchange protein DsbG [Frateuria soli]
MKYWLSFLVAFGLGAHVQAQDAPRYPAPVQALVKQGLVIKAPLQAPAGYTGYLGDYGGRPVPVYLLPDGQHAVVGTLFDATGKDLTSGPLEAATQPALDEATWTRLDKAAWIAEGAARPRRIVYVFTDTECPYCHKLWEASQPYLASGDVQVRHVMVAVIAPQSAGRAAALLDAADPRAALAKHERAFGHSPVQPLKDVPAATARRIESNNALMDSLGISGTPATVYKDDKGKIRMAVGMLPPDRIEAIFGS